MKTRTITHAERFARMMQPRFDKFVHDSLRAGLTPEHIFGFLVRGLRLCGDVYKMSDDRIVEVVASLLKELRK